MLLFSTRKIWCDYFHFSGKTPWVGFSGLHCKRTSLCLSHCGWTESDHSVCWSTKKWSDEVEQTSHCNIVHYVIRYTRHIWASSFFLLWWKLEALFPNILHQTIYNLCKICEFENTFPTITHYEYSKISSLCFFSKDAVPSYFLFLWKKIWISSVITQDSAYLKY